MTADHADAIRSLAPYLESWLAFRGEYTGVPGLQAAVRVGGELVLNTAWGDADAVSGVPMTTGHLFRIASHSKSMTATSVMQLVESGSLRLDDTAAAHIPELKGTDVGSVTIRELLGHQGGVIRDGSESDFWQRGYDFPDRTALLDCLRTEGAVLSANELFKYSNIGYSLLGAIVESASGRPYNDYVTAEIVNRLHLEDFGPEYAADRAEDYAAGHTARLTAAEPRQRIGHIDTRAMSAATGWYSTAADLTRYGAAHTFGDVSLISDKSKRITQREESRVKVRGEVVGRYGLGFDLRSLGDREVIGHSGGYPGHITRTWIDPNEGIVISVLTNAIDGHADPFATGLFSLIDLALDDTGPKSDRDLTEYSGRFACLWGVLDIVPFGGRLLAIDPRQADPAKAHQTLSIVDDTIRTERIPGFGPTGETIRYDRDSTGAIAAVHVGGMTHWPIDKYRDALNTGNPQPILEKMSL